MADPITRSGSYYSLPRDANRVPVMGGVLSSDGKTATPLEVDANGNLLVSASVTPASGIVDSNNSTTTPLAGNATFTGTGTSILGYGYITIYLYADQSSAANGLKLEFSSDNSTWNDASLFSFTAGGSTPNDGQTYGVPPRAQYFRIVYTNGSSAQGTFKLQTVLKPTNSAGDLVTMVNLPNSTNHALLTKSSIVGLTTAGGGGYVDVKVNPSGSLTTALGDITGVVGQNTMANSLPVTIASNQSNIPVSQATASALNATVVGTGTFATQATLQAGSAAVGYVGTSPNAINVGQQTVNTTAVQLSATATVPTNGILVQALSTNGASIFVGGSGVTTSNGWELQPGQCIAFTCTLNTIYIRSAASTTDKVCYQVV